MSPADERAADAPRHVPVMLAEVLASLAPRDGDLVIDGTFGAGGYSRAILAAAATRVIAIDRDPRARTAAAPLLAAMGGRLQVLAGSFGDMEALAAAAGITGVDAVVLDIGVSSMQLDTAERGFSFMADGPLDMRMNPDEGVPVSVALRGWSDEQLADIIFHYGEERQARRIARAIVAAREKQPLETTRQLAALIERAIGRPRGDGPHPATRTFQALRIWANAELDELARGLAAAERLLRPAGRLVVVTFHSLEDRVVKRFLAERSGRSGAGGSRHLPPDAPAAAAPSFRIVNRQPLTPSQGEIAANPRSRSAKLRAAARTDAAPVPLGDLESLGVPQPQRHWRR